MSVPLLRIRYVDLTSFLWGRCWWRRWGCDEILLSWLIGEPTVAIWTFTFHKKSGFVRVILKANFNLTHRPNPSIFGCRFRSINLIFLLFFEEFVKSTAFYTLLLLLQRVDMRKMNIIDLTFQPKKLMDLACRLNWNLPSKSPWFFVKCKCPNSYIVVRSKHCNNWCAWVQRSD